MIGSCADSCGSWLGFRLIHNAGKSLSAASLHVEQLGNVVPWDEITLYLKLDRAY